MKCRSRAGLPACPTQGGLARPRNYWNTAMNAPRLALMTTLAVATAAQAATPSLTNIRPQGLQRGTEMEVVFNGARLTDAKELLFHTAGVSVVDFKVVSDAQVKVKLKAAADCR